MKKTFSLKLVIAATLSGTAAGYLPHPLRADTQQFTQEATVIPVESLTRQTQAACLTPLESAWQNKNCQN